MKKIICVVYIINNILVISDYSVNIGYYTTICAGDEYVRDKY